MLDVGVDLHKRFSQVGLLDEYGEIQQRRVEHVGKEMEDFLRQLQPGSRIAVEATRSWWWFVDLAEGLGHQVVMSHPKATKAIAHARLKNDKVDAAMLACLLRANLLPTVWIPPAPLRHAKELLRHRFLLMRFRTALRNQIGALLSKRNLQPPTRSTFTRAGRTYLEGLTLKPEAMHIRENGLSLLHQLDRMIGQLDRDLEQQIKKNPLAIRLMTAPGVGAQTAFAFITFVGEIERFRSAKHLASYFGLAPRVRSSGGHKWSGAITKEGERMMRWLLIEAAGQAARQPGPLREYYRRMVYRKGKSKARVALAHKLIGVLFHLWKEELTYHEFLCLGAAKRVSPATSVVN